ncbi:MAG: ORF6N domain-containing protein [Deltaproteobacteria bacterium]|jgi:hypothetical protein|nr:ORF6N domain-containing protein [Deltaproteobacteria bacterium]
MFGFSPIIIILGFFVGGILIFNKKNNPDKFPEGYIFGLNKNEWNGLKSKFSTSIKGGKVKWVLQKF